MIKTCLALVATLTFVVGLAGERDDAEQGETAVRSTVFPLDASTGLPADAGSSFATFYDDDAITGDGRYVFFSSHAGDLVAGVTTPSIYRYAVADGSLQVVREGTGENDAGIGFFDFSDDGETVLYGDPGLVVASAEEDFAPRSLIGEFDGASGAGAAVLSGNGRYAALSLDGAGSFVHDIASGRTTRVSQETTPSNDVADDALLWRIGRPAGITDDGRRALFDGSFLPAHGGGSGAGDLANTAAGRPVTLTGTAYLYDADTATVRLVAPYSYRVACDSCAPANGGMAPLLSADGETVIAATVPPERRGDDDPERDIAVYDVASGKSTVLPGSSGANGVSASRDASTIAWRRGFVHEARRLDSGERWVLTDSGYSACGPACLIGQSTVNAPRVSADGSAVVFYARTSVASDRREDDRIGVLDTTIGEITLLEGEANARAVTGGGSNDIGGDGHRLVFETAAEGHDGDPVRLLQVIDL